MKQFVYFFGNGKAEGDKDMKFILGGKGANLAEMTNLGIPVPPGFTISTEVCKHYNENNKQYPFGLDEQIDKAIEELEKSTGKEFGSSINPLLVSVRSGAAASMPGMMDTILNLGLNESTLQGMIKKTDNPRFAWDAYRRFIQMFSNVVENIEHEKYEHIIAEVKQEKGHIQDTDLTAADWQIVVSEYKKLFKLEKGYDFPQDVRLQLKKSIEAVFKSWQNPRAIIYRSLNKIDDTKVFGTAVNVQSMVFGNLGNDSGTGVAFTRNPSTGEAKRYGEYLMNAQGEDVVAGIRTPKTLEKLAQDNEVAYQELLDLFTKLENHYKDMQDVEFTIENGTLYILQTRNGKRTAPASVKIAVDLVNEGFIDEKTALTRVEADRLDQLLHPSINPQQKANFKLLGKGLPASPGAVSGQIVFSAADAVDWAENGKKVILVRPETSPEDIAGMNVALGILTARGGMTSHAAVVARGMGKCCVSGCDTLIVSESQKVCHMGDQSLKEGDIITLDGTTGEVFLGQVPTISPELSSEFGILMKWADKYRKMNVRTNADTPKDAKVALDFGAEGIGLCRTEHMFFEEDRIFAVRQMIVSDTLEQRQAALAKIFPMQKGDFKELYQIMAGHPVKIRLLDPPLHEFLPKEDKDIISIAAEIGISEEKLREKIDYLAEFNPMMGHRGCRLGVTFPEIYQMQVKAIIEAAIELKKESNQEVTPEIMIPLIGDVAELKWLKDKLVPVIEESISKSGISIKYEIGTMIEIPRAAITADEVATEADFFSFGTNDLTQMTFGFSRDDANKFLKDYIKERIFKEDPFKSVDQAGVGKLMEMAIKLGRQTKKHLHVGICGEQGGDPETIKFCHKIGLDYVSCSPYRVPIARLAAAQAQVEEESK